SRNGHVAEWLRNGLQNRVPRFNSGRGLHLRFRELRVDFRRTFRPPIFGPGNPLGTHQALFPPHILYLIYFICFTSYTLYVWSGVIERARGLATWQGGPIPVASLWRTLPSPARASARTLVRGRAGTA